MIFFWIERVQSSSKNQNGRPKPKSRGESDETHHPFANGNATGSLRSAITVRDSLRHTERRYTSTTEVLVILTPRPGVTPQQIIAVMPSEVRATVKLYLDGKIRQWYSRGDGKGVVFFVDAKTEDEARAVMESLPLAKEQLMDHQYIPVGPLMPLRMLIGPGGLQ